jgi:hypothetical protein
MLRRKGQRSSSREATKALYIFHVPPQKVQDGVLGGATENIDLGICLYRSRKGTSFGVGGGLEAKTIMRVAYSSSPGLACTESSEIAYPTGPKVMITHWFTPSQSAVWLREYASARRTFLFARNSRCRTVNA